MAILSFKIITNSTYHSLRAISVATFPPALLLLLIQGIASRRVNPAIGILPLFFSSLYSAFLLSNEKKCGCASAGLTGTPIHLLCDLLLGIGLLVCLILTWVYLPQHWEGSLIMLGTYGSNFIFVNFLTHLYFVAKQVNDSFSEQANGPNACPQCQHGPFPLRIRIETRDVATGDYAPLLDGEGRETTSIEEGRRDGGDAMV